MKCFVTGATGFIGSNLVRELIDREHRVKVLLTPGADERCLQGLKYEKVTGDIFDRKLLIRELDGFEWCFHTAECHDRWMRRYAPMYKINVEGARTVLEAAGKAGCHKIIHTSTAGCIGIPKAVNGVVTPSPEFEKISEEKTLSNYIRSKFKAEGVALELFRKIGLPVVIVNPTTPVGPGDGELTRAGKLVVDYLNRRKPAIMEAGANWVHIRDVVLGHILAAEKGQIGKRYILGNTMGNWTRQQTLEVLGKITGQPAPKTRNPNWLTERRAEISEFFAFLTGWSPRVSAQGVQMGKHMMWYDPSKTIRELKLPQTPPEQAFADAVEWFRANGYVKK